MKLNPPNGVIGPIIFSKDSLIDKISLQAKIYKDPLKRKIPVLKSREAVLKAGNAYFSNKKNAINSAKV